jgi:GTP-binding protein
MQVDFIKSALSESHYPSGDKPEVAFAGRSNVGKSSLINALVNRRKLAKTSATPGRTRAINFFSVDNRFYMVDLPGYGYAAVAHEVKKGWGEMIETYLRKRTNLKAVVVILDIRRDPGSGDMDLVRWLKEYGRRPIPVLTKADKLSRHQALLRAKVISESLKPISDDTPTLFSAKTKEGRREVWNRIMQAMEIENLLAHRL